MSLSSGTVLFSNRCQHSILCFDTWMFIILTGFVCFNWCDFLPSVDADQLKWNLEFVPVVFGSTAELSCIIADDNNACTEKLRQWIGGKHYTSLCQNMRCSDGTKYHVKSESSCSYTLMIYNFSMNDVNCDYACFYGTDSYRRNLQLNIQEFVSVPNVIHKNVSLTGHIMDIQVYIEDVYPSPTCHALLAGKNINYSLLVVPSKTGYFYDVQIQLTHPINRCSGNATILCYLGNLEIRVLNQYINDCSDNNTSQSTLSYVWYGAFACIAVVVGTVVLRVVSLWRYRRPRHYCYKDVLAKNDSMKLVNIQQNSATKKRYFVRIMILGKESAGKTSLMRRLMRENISGVSNKNGVDIVVRQCKINIDSGEWIIDKEYIDFWLDSIYCQRTVEQSGNKLVFDCIHPSVFLVFTGLDKYKKANMGKQSIHNRKKELQTQLDKVMRNRSKYQQLPHILWLSNTTDSDEEFEKLRRQISATAMKMDHWGEVMPSKWIRLEGLIELSKKNGKNFISLSDMARMAGDCDIIMQNFEELLSFLRCQHESGTIIFFNDIRDFIILNPKWLVDAFHCLMSHNIVDERLDLTQFKRTGEISKSLINELFKSKCGNQFSEQRENLIKVMEKFDILVKIGDRRSYIMPSMMPSVAFDEICEIFCVENSSCTRTSWLCLKFSLIPPALFSHICVWFLQKYKPSKLDKQGQSHKLHVALFRGICIFDINTSGHTKLLVTVSNNTVALQILLFSKEEEECEILCSNIRKDILTKISDLEKRYKKKIFDELHLKCNNGYYYNDTISYQKLRQSTTYFCSQHQTEHQSAQICMPWMKN